MDDRILCHITFERGENGKRNETNIRKRHRQLSKYKGDQSRRATAMRQTYLGKNAHLHVLRYPIARSCDHCFCQRRSAKTPYNKKIITFEKHLMERGYPQNFINNTLSEVKFQERTQDLISRNKKKVRILPCVTQYHPAVPNLKEILTRK